MNAKKLRYALITPARNEKQYIGSTIESVISQTIKPVKWIIVSDGSTDGTDEIVKSYKKYSWIELLRMPEHKDRHFAAKAICFNTAYERLKNKKFDIIGNLDADVSFEPDYFEFLLQKFEQIPGLGVAGTPFIERQQSSYRQMVVNPEHVSGPCQIFRRDCYEQIGGYIPIKSGGIDWTAVTTARMHGWITRTFPGKEYIHHRSMGTAEHGIIMSRFLHGQKDYYLGGDPLWEIFRTFYQMTRKPYVIGGLSLLAGFVFAGIKGVENPVSEKLIRFHRQEQRKRLKMNLVKMVMMKRD